MLPRARGGTSMLKHGAGPARPLRASTRLVPAGAPRNDGAPGYSGAAEQCAARFLPLRLAKYIASSARWTSFSTLSASSGASA